MTTHLIEKHFAKIGARAKIHPSNKGRSTTGVTIDIGNDKQGEFFDIALARISVGDIRVVDLQPRMRHLLLMSDQNDGKHKFLCGHDERHWFVAAVPERASVSNVKTAFEALQPQAVQWELDRKKVKRKKRNRRRNEAFVRQGEWFFIPASKSFDPNPLMILYAEPLRRGNGKPHTCDELVRQGGELVYVSTQHPNGLTQGQYRNLISRKPELRHLGWVTQRRNPGVFVRGRVRHADHKTVVLSGWHQVLMNTETQSMAMRHVAFID